MKYLFGKEHNNSYGCDLSSKYKDCPGGGNRSNGVFYCEECDHDVCYHCFLYEKEFNNSSEENLIKKEVP